MRVVLVGEVELSRAMFREILESSLDVVGICARDGGSAGSDKVNLKSFADAAGVSSRVVKSINDPETIIWLKSLAPEAIFCLGWSEILRDEVLSVCPGRIIGYHPTNLPRNRGRHPLIWTLALGLRETASTFFIMNEGTDSGDILSQEFVSVDDNDYAGDLYEKVIAVARVQVRDICQQLVSNCLMGRPQDPTQASYWRKRTRKDGLIDWRMSSSSIRNLVRALSDPYPGATFQIRDVTVICHRARAIPWDSPDIEPGKVLAVSKSSLVVKTADGAIELTGLTGMPAVEEGDYL